MKNILIISGHPDLQQSVANKTIIETLEQALPQAEIRRLDILYPDYRFDITAEQAALLKADIIVWQFPFSWHSIPGVMKLWLDKVFLHGFAHGAQGKLGGKKLLLSFTTGAPESIYQKDGFFRHIIEEYLPPFETIATLCNLEYQPPIYTTGISYTDRANEAAINAQKERAEAHAEKLVAALNALAA